MIRNSGVEECLTKQDGGARDDGKEPGSTRSSWTSTMMRNPRIVRVSRACGGKDRHSKVTTVRGLRDRRVRLSVPTAIQLYDLQDKLGFNQPSKVVDWLLNVAQHEIDKLPPLQMLPGNFIQFPQMSCAPKSLSVNCMIGDGPDATDAIRAQQLDLPTVLWNSEANMRMTSNETPKEANNIDLQENRVRGHEAGNDQCIVLERSGIPFAAYSTQWEPSNAHIGYSGGHSSQLQAFYPTPMFESNFDHSKAQYSYYDATRGFVTASQENLAFRHQQHHEEH